MKANITTSRLKSVNIIVIYLKDRNLSTVVGEKRNAQRGLKMGPSHSRWLTPPSLRSRLAHYEHSLTPACLGPCCHNLPEAVSPASGHSSGLGLKVRHNHSQAVHCLFHCDSPWDRKERGDHDGPADHDDLGRLNPHVLSHCHTLSWIFGSCLPIMYPAHSGFSWAMAAALAQPKAGLSQQVFFFLHF